MKILLSADFHGDFTRLFQLAKGVDLCICCGDIFDYHRLPRENFAFPLPFFSIKGNKEIWGGERLQRILESYHNFFWLNDHVKKLKEITDQHFSGINHLYEPTTIPDNIDVLVSHEPAYGLADQCSDPFHAKIIPHCGSKAVRRLVDRYEPKFLLAGHVHYHQKQKAGKTLAVTLPPALIDPILVIEDKNLVCLKR